MTTRTDVPLPVSWKGLHKAVAYREDRDCTEVSGAMGAIAEKAQLYRPECFRWACTDSVYLYILPVSRYFLQTDCILKPRTAKSTKNSGTNPSPTLILDDGRRHPLYQF